MEYDDIERQRELALILLTRLEKISADSPWAHQASGVRASIAKLISREELSLNRLANQKLKQYLELGFKILEQAAGDIPED